MQNLFMRNAQWIAGVLLLAIAFSVCADDREAQKAQVIALDQKSTQYLAENRIEDALRTAEEALILAGSAYGPTDPTTLTLQYNYGTFLAAVGQHANARKVLSTALSTFERVYGEDSVELVPMLVALGQVQFGTEQTAVVYRALALQKKHKPDDRLAYATLAYKTGAYLAVQRFQRKEAKSILSEALEIFEQEYGSNSPALIPVLMSLGDAEARFLDTKNQTRRYKRALKLAKKAGDDIQYAELMQTAGSQMMQLSASRLARNYLEKAHDIFEKELGPKHVKTARAKLSLARFNVATGRHKKAEKLLLSALRVFKNDRNYRNQQLLTLTLLVEVNETLGKRQAATQYVQAISQISPWTEDQEYRPVYSKSPVYPAAALDRRSEGYVVLEFMVDENGLVQSPKVVERKGHKSFESAALKSVQSYRYAPRYKDGKPVATTGVRNMSTFEIKD